MVLYFSIGLSKSVVLHLAYNVSGIKLYRMGSG